MLASTPWSAMLPFNGQPAVLANVASPTGAALFAGNAASTPFYIVHGALDLLYPLASVKPWWTLFEAAGMRPVKHVKNQNGHDIRWWPEEAPAIDAFIQEHPRDPLRCVPGASGSTRCCSRLTDSISLSPFES